MKQEKSEMPGELIGEFLRDQGLDGFANCVEVTIRWAVLGPIIGLVAPIIAGVVIAFSPIALIVWACTGFKKNALSKWL